MVICKMRTLNKTVQLYSYFSKNTFYCNMVLFIYFYRMTHLPLQGLREQDDYELLEFIFMGGLDGNHRRNITQLKFSQQMIKRAQRRYQVAQARRSLVTAKTRVPQEASNSFQRFSQCSGQRSHSSTLGFTVHYARPRGQTLYVYTKTLIIMYIRIQYIANSYFFRIIIFFIPTYCLFTL